MIEPKKETETSGKVTQYTYDAAGNRETEKVTVSISTGSSIASTTYHYNEQNRLVSTTQVQSDGIQQSTTYVYDNNGNMTKKSFEQTRKIDPSNPPKEKFGMYIEGQPDATTNNAKDVAIGAANYEYDVWNQLVKAVTGEGTCTYKYNGEDYRTERRENGITTRSLYEADKVILETDPKGNQVARNVYGTNLLVRTAGADTFYYMYNGHGDVTALIDANGKLRATYYYDAFGNPDSTGTKYYNASGNAINETVNNNITYAGYQYDSVTDLYYLNARMYDPKIARFMQEDTYTGEKDDPLSLNLYTYSINNPLIYIDPTGHIKESDKKILTEEGLFNIEKYTVMYDAAKEAALRAKEDNDMEMYKICKNTMSKAREEADKVRNSTEYLKVFKDTNLIAGGASYLNINFSQIDKGDQEDGNESELALFGTAAVSVLDFGSIIIFTLFNNLINMNERHQETIKQIEEARSKVKNKKEELTTEGAENTKFPDTPEEMDELLGQEGKEIPDGPNTQGRNKVKWKLPDGTEVTYEQHPYDVGAPEYHTEPHYHVSIPGEKPHITFRPVTKYRL